MSNTGVSQLQEWVDGRFPRLRPYLRRLICQALDLRSRGNDGAPEADWDREADAFLAYYRSRYKTVSGAVKAWDLPESAIREVRKGLLLSFWQADPAKDFESQIRDDLGLLEAAVLNALPATLASQPFEDFPNHLRTCLWRRVIFGGTRASAADLEAVARRETRRVAAWEIEVGTQVDASVKRRFPRGAPDGLSDNIRKIIWQQDIPEWREFLKDAIDVAAALADNDWERVESIVTRRVAGVTRKLLRDFPEIEAEDILQSAWLRVLAKYFPLTPERAPELFALLAVIARRVIIDCIRKRLAPGPIQPDPHGSGPRTGSDSSDEPPDLRRLAYAEFPPHQSLAWTWIDVFSHHPRDVAKSCCKETLLSNANRVRDVYEVRGCSRPVFLEPLQQKLQVAFGRISLKRATLDTYPHLLTLVCGETRFYQYLTNDLPDVAEQRLAALDSRDENQMVRSLKDQMTHWAQTVNRVWRPAAIELIFFGAQFEDPANASRRTA